MPEGTTYEWVNKPQLGDTEAQVKVIYSDGSYDVISVAITTPSIKDETGETFITSGGNSEADAIDATNKTGKDRPTYSYSGRAWIENEGAFGSFDKGDVPVEGLKVYLQWKDGKNVMSPVFTTTTNAEGKYSFHFPGKVQLPNGQVTEFKYDFDPKFSIHVWTEEKEGYSIVKSGDMHMGYTTRIHRSAESWNFTAGINSIAGSQIQYQRKPNYEEWLAKPEDQWVRPDTADGYWQDKGIYGTYKGLVWYENDETGGGVTNEYLFQKRNGDFAAVGMEVVASYVNDEVARQFDQWKKDNKGFTHEQFKQAQKDIITAYDAEHGKGAFIAETVVGKVDSKGEYYIPFRGLYGVSRDKANSGAKISWTVTDEEYGTVVKDEDLNNNKLMKWNGTIGQKHRHINYDYSYVYPLVENQNVWMKMFQDNMFQTTNEIGGTLGEGYAIAGLQFAILAPQPQHNVNEYDTNNNIASPNTTVTTATKGLTPTLTYKLRWFKTTIDDKGNAKTEALGTAKEAISDIKGLIESDEFKVPDTLTQDTIYTSAIFLSSSTAESLDDAVLSDSFMARPIVRKPANETDPVPTGYTRVTFLPGNYGSFEGSDQKIIYDILDGYTIAEAIEKTQNAAVKLILPTVKANDAKTPFKEWEADLLTAQKFDEPTSYTEKMKSGQPITFTAEYQITTETEADKYEPKYEAVDGKVGEEATVAKPTFTDKEGNPATPENVTYELGEGAPTGATVNPDGSVTYTPAEADAGQTVNIPVVVKYSDGTTDKVNAPINVAKLDDIIDRTGDEDKPTPAGYVRVTFKADEGVNDIANNKVYDVKEGTKLPADKYPTVTAKEGYENPKWSTKPGTAITADNATITATATAKTQDQTATPTVEKPKAGDKEIKGKATPGSDVTVELPDGTKVTGKADENGDWKVTVPEGKDLVENDEIKVTAKDGDKAP